MDELPYPANLHSWYGAEYLMKSPLVRWDQSARVKKGDKPGYRLPVGDGYLFLKFRYHGRPIARVNRLIGHTNVQNEYNMSWIARSLGLPVPAPIACSRWSPHVLRMPHSLVIEWLEGHVLIRRWVKQNFTKANRASTQDMERVEIEMARLFSDVRAAGLTEPDFGAHNMMYPETDPLPENLKWIDLEDARFAAPGDTAGTVEMLHSMLANWWVTTGGDTTRLQNLCNEVVRCCHEPDAGWEVALKETNKRLANTTQKRADHGEVASASPELLLQT